MESLEKIQGNIRDLITLVPCGNSKVSQILGFPHLKQQDAWLTHNFLRQDHDSYEKRNLREEGWCFSNSLNNVSLLDNDKLCNGFENYKEEIVPIWKATQSNLAELFKTARKVVDQEKVHQAELGRRLNFNTFFDKVKDQKNRDIAYIIDVGVKQGIFKTEKPGGRKYILPGNTFEYKPCEYDLGFGIKLASRAESRMAQYYVDEGYIFQSQKWFRGLIGDKRLLRFDFYLPQQEKTNYRDVLVEMQGRQHYEVVKYFGGQEQFNKQQNYDQKKRLFTKEEDYKLIEIPYWEDEILFFQKAMKLRYIRPRCTRKIK